MTATDASTNPVSSSRRARVVYVGRSAADLAGVDGESFDLVAVPDVFHALGEVNRTAANRPVLAVLIDEAQLAMNRREVSEAFATLDPSVRLILIQSSPGASDGLQSSEADARQLGFDEVLTGPLDPALIRHAVHNGHGGSASRGGTAHAAPGPVPGPSHDASDQPSHDRPPHDPPCEPSQNGGGSASAGAASGSTTLDDVMASDDDAMNVNLSDSEIDAMAAAPARPDRIDQADGETDPPGDVDLIDAVMNRPEELVDLALRAMAAHGRLVEPAFRRVTGANDEDEPNNGVAVTAPRPEQAVSADGATTGGRVFGRLFAANTDPEQLRPWAEWFGWWLALDRKVRTLRRWSYQDELTGAWNRRFFFSFVQQTIDNARTRRLPVTVMLFDLDDFKVYNDDFGHEAGDEILRETVSLLKSVIRRGDRVCRIGGDEFAVIFADLDGPREPGSAHPDSIEQVARRFQDQVCRMKFPKLGPQAPATLSISAGIATFPWDGQDPATLLRVADERALESKKRGKNAITFGPGASCRDRDSTKM